MKVAIDCQISETGAVKVKKIKQGNRWVAVGQGRQWQDGNGRHVLIMLPTEEVWEIVLRPDTLIWEKSAAKFGHRSVMV
ncbi:MAG: hypothetical protein AAF490_21140 [Chloroflexota bacterium]